MGLLFTRAVGGTNALRAIVFLSLTGGMAVSHAGTIEVTGTTLNVRTGASTSNSKIGLVSQGQLYVSLQKQGAWHQIDFDNRKGWVHGDYVRASSQASVTVRVDSKLNVRSGPGSQYRDVGDTFNGQKWVVRSSSGVWRNVNFKGGSYWMHSSYLSSGGNTDPGPNLPPSSAGLVQVPNTANGLSTYSVASKRWGTPKLVYGLLRAADKRITANRNQGRVVIGNISRKDGSKPASVHKTHHSGRYADMRPLGKGTYDGPIHITGSNKQHYSRSRTREWIQTYLRGEFGGSMATPLFNDQTLINEGVSRYVGGHHNHIHIQVN